MGGFIKAAWDSTVGAAWDTAEDTVGGVVEDIVDTTVDFGKEIFNASNELVFGGTATILEAVGLDDAGKVLRNIGDTIYDVEVTMLDYAGSIISNPQQIFDDPLKAISLAVAAIFAIPTAGASLVAWVALYSGALNVLTSDMVKYGWIDENTAMILNVVGTIALAWVAGGGTAPVNSGYISAIQGLEALGISSQTANIIVGYAAEASMLLSTTTGQAFGALYSVYQSVQQSLMLEQQYKYALAAFEKWKHDFEQAIIDSAKTDQEIADFVSGAYYRKMAGQQLFNVNIAGHERYVATDVQRPSWGLDTKPAYNVEPEVAKLMWYNKQFDMAGGGSFVAVQTGIPKFTGA